MLTLQRCLGMQPGQPVPVGFWPASALHSHACCSQRGPGTLCGSLKFNLEFTHGQQIGNAMSVWSITRWHARHDQIRSAWFNLVITRAYMNEWMCRGVL